MNTDNKIANLAAALVKAQSLANGVAKSSVNSFQRYKYASAEALIEEGRHALSEAGLALMTISWEVLPLSVEPKEGTKQAPSSRMRVKYLLVHASGETMSLEAETSIIPENGRPADKAEATALTYNLGYMIRGLLLLPREDESIAVDRRDDRERREERREERKQEPQNDAPVEDFEASIARAASIDELKAIGARIAKTKPDAARQAALKKSWEAKKEQISKAEAA